MNGRGPGFSSFLVFSEGKKGSCGCKVSDYKVEGNTVSWTFKCEGKKGSSGQGSITYEENSYAGEITMDTDGQEMTMKMSGKRLGDCEK